MGGGRFCTVLWLCSGHPRREPIKEYSEGRPDLWMGLMVSDAGAVQYRYSNGTQLNREGQSRGVQVCVLEGSRSISTAAATGRSHSHPRWYVAESVNCERIRREMSAPAMSQRWSPMLGLYELGLRFEGQMLSLIFGFPV